jgi:flagellar secretion chaperone FliS
MFGLNRSGASVYSQMSVETGVLAASPNKLTIMLYEGAITACRSAIEHMKNKDIQHKGEMLSKAILIIESGLRLSLDKKAGGEIAESLDSLYAYMSHRLTVANIRNQPEMVSEVIKLLADLKSAWEAIGEDQVKPATISQMTKPLMTNQGQLAVNKHIANYVGA